MMIERRPDLSSLLMVVVVGSPSSCRKEENVKKAKHFGRSLTTQNTTVAVTNENTRYDCGRDARR